jgi:hypothetical protein
LRAGLSAQKTQVSTSANIQSIPQKIVEIPTATNSNPPVVMKTAVINGYKVTYKITKDQADPERDDPARDGLAFICSNRRNSCKHAA